MRRMLLPAFLLLLFFGSAAIAEDTPRFDPLIEQLSGKFSQYVLGVEITVTTTSDDGTSRSSVVWTPGIRITDDSVLISAARLPENPLENTSFRLVSGDVRFRAELKSVNLRANVALLTQTSGSRVTGLSFTSDSELSVGDKCYALSVLPPAGKYLCKVAPFYLTAAIDIQGVNSFATDVVQPSLTSPSFVGVPVFNSDMKLVGMLNVNRADNTIIVLSQSSSVRKAVGGAINPSDTSLRRCWFGAFTSELTPAWKDKLGLPADLFGALIEDVIPGSPAAVSGLKSLDIVLAINGLPIAGFDAASLNRYVGGNFRPNTEITLVVFRDGARSELKVALTESPATYSEAPKFTDEKVGIEVREITTDVRLGLGLKLEDKGLLVSDITPNKPFQNALKAVLGVSFDVYNGTVVQTVDGKTVNTIAEFEAALKEARKSRKYTTFFLRYNLEDEIGCVNSTFIRLTFED